MPGLALVNSRARAGVRAPAVRVEVHLGGGLPSLSIVGLPEAAVRESKDRVRAAIQCSQFEFPGRRITVNLAPADLPKDGGRFDLPIALGILAASGQIPLEALAGCECLGELALTGELRPVEGVLPAAVAATEAGRSLIVPVANGAEAALVDRADVRVARTLLEVCAHLQGVRELPVPAESHCAPIEPPPDLADVRGQAQARRALEIAAAGGHHLLLVGPPGCGKTMLASRLPGILPPATESEALETAAITSVSGRGLDPRYWRRRPFRAPHHSASAVALAGGGSEPRPGEISLAHNGVLFLDELAEWSRPALEVLRQPLESGQVTISRAARQADFPASFQLVAAMNPCPCGWAGDPSGRCRCSGDQVARYLAKLSGPLLDRIDLHLNVPRLARGELRQDAARGEPSDAVRARVVAARQRQHDRQGGCNARMDPAQIEKSCRLSTHDEALLERAMDRLQLSARASTRILRVARTIADLADCETIGTAHITEAIGYRSLDRARQSSAYLATG
ncbi:MAG: YifB family Mg chelatase-like AAA ATPase [Xanthomonadaceae bacterium]|nr:YifB family Mg chelatase-like AAA ATPase [Xanthomonadaceae bacterium]